MSPNASSLSTIPFPSNFSIRVGWELRILLSRDNRCEVSLSSGGDCVGDDITWKDVKPLFGYWRIAPWTLDRYSNFSECLYPLACLGGINIGLRGKFIVGNIDYAMQDSQEMCNYDLGYEKMCSRDENNHRCRLCATCKAGYRHKDVSGILRCDKCPEAAANKGLLALGVLIVVVVMCAMVMDRT